MQEKNKQQALRYLAVRMRSEKEMRQYMQKKHVDIDEIDEIIAYLYHYNYLDDMQFAKSFVRDKLQFHPCGRHKMIFALKEKGIDDFTIEDVLAELFPEEKEWELVYHDYDKCQQKGKNYQQTMRYLYGKGYSVSLLSRLEKY